MRRSIPTTAPADWCSQKYGMNDGRQSPIVRNLLPRAVGMFSTSRGFLARNGWQASPLNKSNPLAAEWGTVLKAALQMPQQNGPFTGTYTSRVYWQDIVLTLR